MKLQRLGFVLGTALLFAACPKGTENPTPPADPPAATDPAAPAAKTEGQVCCESFGYGAMMAKCCESYSWTAPGECVVPEGMVGGGRAVVADEKCP